MADPNFDPFGQMQRLMRMQNIFAPQPMQPNPMQQDPMQGPGMINQPNNPVAAPEYDISKRLEQLYTPQTGVSDMYMQNIQGMPQRTNPGLLSKIGGVMAGLGAGVSAQGISSGQPIGFQGNPVAASQAVDLVANAPYYRKMGDWKNQNEDLRAGAYLENQQNVNERILAEQTIQRELAQQKQKDQDDYNTERLKISADRAAVYRWKAENPEGKLIMTKGGFVQVMDPITKTVTTLKDEKGNPISTGSMTDEDAINLNQRNALSRIGAQGNDRMEQIEAQGAQTRETVQTRDANDWSQPFEATDEDGKKKYVQVNNTNGSVREIKVPGTLKKPGTNTPPRANTTDPNKPLTPAAEKAARYNRARELQSDPKYKQYIDTPNSSNYKVKGRQNYFGWKSEEEDKTIKEINDYIISGKKASTTGTSKSESDNNNNAPAPKSPTPSKTVGNNNLPDATRTTSSTSKPKTREDGKIRVKRKSDGVSGYISSGAYDASKYDKE